MGFFSDLKVLASDIGDIVKDCGQEINGIVKDTKEEFLDDPMKFTVDSVKEIGSAASTVAIAVGKVAIEVAIEQGKKSATYKEDMAEKSIDSCLDIAKKGMNGSSLDNKMKAGAALAEIKSRGHSVDEIKDMLNN